MNLIKYNLNNKKGTIDYYKTKFIKIAFDVFNGVLPLDLNNEDNTDKVIKYIESDRVTLATKRPMVNSWFQTLTALNYDTSILEPHYKRISTEADEKLQYAEPTERELGNISNFIDIAISMRKNKKLINDKFTNYDIYYLICCLYTYLEPLRTQDYINTKLFINSKKYNLDDPDNINYCCLKTRKMHIREFKTDKHHGERIINLSPKLCKIIKNFNLKSKSEYLICSARGSKLIQENFYTLSMNACGVSTNTVRKLYVSDKVIDKSANADERLKIARIMGHKPATQQLAYSKFSVSLHSKDELQIIKQQLILLTDLINKLESKK